MKLNSKPVMILRRLLMVILTVPCIILYFPITSVFWIITGKDVKLIEWLLLKLPKEEV